METQRVFLLPGEMCIAREPIAIATLLGSCVAICLYNKKGHFGGMNHYMLPSTPQGDQPSGKHGNYSIDVLIRMMLSYDQNPHNIDASILGGANVTAGLAAGEAIGAKNIVMAREMLEKYNIPVVNRSVGGTYGRKVYFKNWTGEIELRKIEKSAEAREVQEKKKELQRRQIRVLVVDDSATVRTIITDALNGDPEIEVVGGAADPYEAREMLLEYDPDVICLDVIMPKMDGLTFLKKLFLYQPKPVIIISTVVQKGSKLREQAKQIGAVEVIDKEDLALYKGMDTVRSVLTGKVKSAATVWLKKKTKEELDAI